MSLYNEVRPQTLNEVMGQEKIVAQIRAILQTGNIPNVSLFVGPRGTGKTTLARIYAKALNCESPSEDGPCNKCRSCRDIHAEGSMDVLEMDGASNNKVDDVHRLIESATYAPVGKYKVYIIDEVHMLSNAAFNALLKLLEEPPNRVRFILCTTEEHKVPVTILSRCRKMYFERISPGIITEKMAKICQDRDIPYEAEALGLISRKAEGCMRDAESMLEIFIDAGSVNLEAVSSVLGSTGTDSIFNILSSIATADIIGCLNGIKKVATKGTDFSLLVKNLIEMLSDLVYFHQSKDSTLIDNTASYKEGIESLAEILTAERALEIASAFSDIFSVANNSGDVQFLLETKVLCLASEQSTISKLVAKIDALENALFSLSSGEGFSLVSEVADIKKMEADTTKLPPLPPIFPDEEEVPDNSNIDISGNTLPGDINVPQGAQVLGTISLFGGKSEEGGFISVHGGTPFDKDERCHNPLTPILPEEEHEKAVEEEPETKCESENLFDSLDALGFGEDFSVFPSVIDLLNKL